MYDTGLPSHWGPKVRHNPRPSQLAQSRREHQQKKSAKGNKRQAPKQQVKNGFIMSPRSNGETF